MDYNLVLSGVAILITIWMTIWGKKSDQVLSGVAILITIWMTIWVHSSHRVEAFN